MDNRQTTARADGVRGARIPHAMEDYLKAIFRIEHDGREVTNQRLTEELGLSGASVSNMLKRLHELHLVEYTPYKAISLTDAGNAVALEVIRHHRLLELFLAQALGMDIDQVHAEADRLEHHVSEELERRIEHALGYPEFDPHGHPIPTRAGTLPVIPDVPLTDLVEGESGIVSRLSDRNEENLREVRSWKIAPGSQLTLTEVTDSHYLTQIDASEPVRIPRATAESILVLRPEQITS